MRVAFMYSSATNNYVLLRLYSIFKYALQNENNTQQYNNKKKNNNNIVKQKKNEDKTKQKLSKFNEMH